MAHFTVYQYVVYKTLGQAADAELAQRLARQLAAQFRWEPAAAGLAAQLDQACAIAWLNAQFQLERWAIFSSHQLRELDASIRQVAQQEAAEPGSQYQSTLLRAARYFSLRLPAPEARHALQELLEQWGPAPLVRCPPLLPQPFLLGLANGLAAELLLLGRLTRLGVQHPHIPQRIRQGLLELLAVKRDVDFFEQRYAVFPYQLHEPAGSPVFSAELSWRRGDLGPALVLYEAQRILHDTELKRIAELVGLNTVLRTTAQATEVVGPQFYQGAAGVAHLYDKLYQSSSQAAYRQAYYFWLNKTLDWLGQQAGSGLPPPEEDGLLSGLVGVGLVLLSAVSKNPLPWDEIIL